MRKLGKIITSVTAVVLVGCITITSMTLFSKKEVVVAEDEVSFNGTTAIKNMNSETNPLKIWEIVPSLDMGELSYIYKQDDWEENLKTIQSAEARKSYMNDKLYKLWYGLFHMGESDATSQMPMSYYKYEEKYVLDENDKLMEKEGNFSDDSWKQLELATPDILQKGTKGYRMVEDPAGEYQFEAPYVVADVSDGKYQGEYRQFVEKYSYSEEVNANYGLRFLKVSPEELGEMGDEQLYTVAKSWYITDEAYFNELKEKSPNVYIYRVSHENIFDHYEFVKSIADLNYSDLQSNYYYYRVAFTPVDADAIVDGKKYYRIDKDHIEFYGQPGTDGSIGSGEYAANVGAPYIPVDNGEEGYFNREDDKWGFRFVGEGNGQCHMVKDANAVLDYNVIVGRIYYQGGYVNNRIWDKYVFNVEDGEKINYDITTMTPEMLNERIQKGETSGVDLIYISSRSVIKTNAIQQQIWDGNKDNIAFSQENDISWETARELLLMIKNQEFRLPVIVDRSIIDTNKVSEYGNSNATNLQRMIALMSAKQFFKDADGIKEIEIKENTEIGNIPWNQLSLPWMRMFGDEFINQNVLLFDANSVATDQFQYAATPYIFQTFTKDKIAVNNGGVTAKDDTIFKDVAVKCGVDEIADYIIEENYKRELENNGLADAMKYDYFTREISKSTMIDYILNFEIEEDYNWDGELDILEIQPGRTKDNQPSLKADVLKTAMAQYGVTDVKVTYMTSSEFVGKIEDLTKYDLIYFGLDTSAFTKENNITVYNDSSMDGLVYSNVGDIVAIGVKGTNLYLGMLDSDYWVNKSNGKKELLYFSATSDGLKPDVANQENYRKAHATFRYTGNDISSEKMRDVENYVKAGYPVIVQSDFYKNQKKSDVNDYLIDNCSYVYQLMDDIKGFGNVISTTKVDSESTLSSIMKYVSAGRPEIIIIEPDHYAKNTTEGEGTNAKFFGVDNDTIELKFKVSNEGSANSKQKLLAKLYLDVNADGKFSMTQEEISPLDMILKKNGEEVMVQSQHTVSGNVYYYEVEPGKSNVYSFSYKLPEGTIGVIPWKLVIGQADNKLRTVSKQGYFYNVHLKSNGENENVPTIHVLQINTCDKMINSQKVDKDDKNNQGDASYMSFDMQAELGKEDSKFCEYIHKVKDFKIKVATISSNAYITSYNEDPAHYFDNCVFGNPADMLIMGFGDTYDIGKIDVDELKTKEEQDEARIKNNIAMNGIIDFINSGKPVLFTHDTTSFHYDFDTKWGYQFNSKIRNLVGMDRYGVLSNPYIKKGKILEKDSKDTGSDFAGAVKNAELLKTDIPYVPRSNKTKTVRQTQGISNVIMCYYINGQAKDNRNVSLKYDWPYNVDVMPSYNGNSRKTKSVTQINQGQITNYPFVISENFTVANTHAQYYQLDFNEDTDMDGEGDIVVWYTLANTSAYDCSPKDVRNNYYIYTKGNVTYSGVGHYKLNDKSVNNDDEIKLYINTIVAAYNSGKKPPRISLKDGADDTSADIDTLYVSFDEMLDSQNIQENEAIESEMEKEGKKTNYVYFTVNDKNIVRNLDKRSIETIFGVKTKLTDEEYDKLSEDKKKLYMKWEENGKNIYLEIFNPDITDIDGGQVSVLGSSITYRAQIPSSILKKESNIEVYVLARTKFVRKVASYNDKGEKIESTLEPEYSPYISTVFTMRRIGLTDLD